MLPGYFRKKILNKTNICFVPTSFNILPKNNHPTLSNFENQKKLCKKFNDIQEEITFKTYPNLINLLETKYSKEAVFSFLDFGGDQIDQYFILKKKFPNIKYFVFNQKVINDDFIKLKKLYNFKDLIVINNLKEISLNYFDFVNFGSVLQYVDNYDIILNEILLKAKKYILISGSHFYNSNSTKKKIIVEQVNLLPKKLYLFFFNLDFFLEKFKKYGFKVVNNKKNLTHYIDYKNFETINLFDLKYSDIFFEK